jgi:LysR family glycine cleavage system transcriptional activator
VRRALLLSEQIAMSANHRTSLRGLRTFCVAARHESFRLAGEELHITASAVSHQIKNLEQELDLRLFERGNRELRLTEAGRSLYEDVAPLIEKLDDVVGRRRHAAPARPVRVSVQPFFGSELFVPRLSEFTAASADVDIRVATSDETPETHPADADLSIRLYRAPPAGLPSRRLFAFRMAAAGSPTFKKGLRVHKGKIVSDFPLIVHETFPNAWKEWAASARIALPENAKVTRMGSMIAVVRAVERGIGAGLVTVPAADLWFKHGSIVRLFPEELITDASYFLVWRPEAAHDPHVARLRDWIVQTFCED